MSDMLWTPGMLTAAPKLWLDDESALTMSSGAVSAWADRSGLGMHLSQATAASQPTVSPDLLNGKRMLRFDGSNDYLGATSALSGALFRNTGYAFVLMVMKKRGTSGSAATCLYAPNNTGASRVNLTIGPVSSVDRAILATRRLDADATSNLTATKSVFDAFGMLLVEVDFAGGVRRLRMNGTLDVQDAITAGLTSDTAAAGNNFSIGADYSGGGAAPVDIAAVVLGSGTSLGADVLRLEGWAAHRYGLTANLPAGHPYKTAPPMANVADDYTISSVTGGAPSAGQITQPALSRRWSVEHGGTGRIYGTTRKFLADDFKPPYPCRVRLIREFDGLQIAEQWSGADGSYDFQWVSERWSYTVVTYDHLKDKRAVIADGLTAERMYPSAEVFA